jgi:TonB-linked SusC/RagA family outer membrane protein
MNLRRSVFAFPGLSLALITAVAGPLQAQQQQTQQQQTANRGSITGIVTDATTGTPLNLVSIQVAGTALGGQTNAEGRYTIANVPAGIVALKLTRVGYSPASVENLRVAAGAPTNRDVGMSVQALILSGVVTTGLSDPATGARAPFSIANVSRERLEVAPTGSPLEALIGKVAGLQIRGGTMPGADVVIQIRNPLSITGFTQPLIIVDGVMQLQDDPSIGARDIVGNPLDIDPENIESIEVVRGAAAAALYGQRAANGVINITTKRGTDLALGTTRMTVSNEAGASIIAKTLPYAQNHHFLMNSQGQLVDAGGRPLEAILSDNFVNDPDRMVDNPWPVPIYDNVADLFKMGYTIRNNLQLNQNSLATNFNISASANNESGIMREGGGTSSQRLNVGIDYRSGSSLLAGVGMNFGRTYLSNLAINPEAVGGNANAFLNAQNICKCVSILWRDPATGEYLSHPDGGGTIGGLANGVNPLYFESNRDEWDRRIGLQVNSNVTYRPTSALSISMRGGYNRSDREEQLKWVPIGTLYDSGNISAGEYDVAQSMDEIYNGSTTVQLLTGMGGWTVRANASTGGDLNKRNSISIVGDTLLQNQPDYDFIRLTDIGSVYREVAQVSYSGNVALDYNQKYIVDLVYRTEGNSNLPADTRWGSNGRASAAWSMSEEPWWPLTDFSLFKPRYSIGTAGNNPAFSARFELYNQLTGTGVTRVTKINLGNAEIQPEEVTEQEFGLDMAFRNRYSLSLTYIRNTVKDQIRPDTLLAYTGFDTQLTNLGDLRGDAYEATLEAQWIQQRNFRWSSTLVLDRGRQKITSYPRQCNTSVGNVNTANSTYQRYCEGYVFGEIYGRYHMTDKSQLSPRHQASGAAETHFDINDEGYVIAVGAGGKWTDMRWGQEIVVDNIEYEWGLPIFGTIFDSDGFPDGPESKVIGQGLPDFSFGFGNQLVAGPFTVSAQTVGQVGGRILNQAMIRAMNRQNHAILDQGGKPDYMKKTIDYYIQGESCCDPNNQGIFEGNYGGITSGEVLGYPRFTESGTFLKLSELRVAYRLDEGLPLLSRLGMTGGSLALVARDLFTISPYSGYDPQVGGTTSSTTARVDRAVAPNYRSITAQLRLFF